MIHRIGTICLFGIAAVFAGGTARQAPGRYEQTIDVSGVTRSYIVRVPRSLDPSKPTPLVLVLHGWTTSAKLAEVYTRMSEQAEKSGFIVVFPDGLGNPKGWNAGFIDLSGKKGDDVGFVSAVIDKIEADNSIDKDRVYVCGHSNGAFMAEEIGAVLGKRLAAIGIVAGTIGIPGGSGTPYKTIPNPEAPVSEIAIHSRKDVMVAYDSSCSAVLKCMPAEDCAKWWAEKDGCMPNPIVTTSLADTVQTTLYKRGRRGTEVELITLSRGSHDWPGGYTRTSRETDSGFDAAQALWDFFVAHPRHRR